MPLKICSVNFWPGFTLEHGFVRYLIETALGPFTIVPNEKDADVVLTSVFPRLQRLKAISSKLELKRPRFPEKAIAIIFENVRPDYSKYAYSISSDFDSYGGRNARVPYWYGQLTWPGMTPDGPWKSKKAWSGYEPTVDIDSLMTARPATDKKARDGFCCFVAANAERHRMLATEALGRIGQVDLYGKIAGKAFQGSKYDLLARYRFNLCFENSLFPGYYTEKLLQSWVGGCVPLYFADHLFDRDFNPACAINRAEFPTLDEFAEAVAEIHRDDARYEEIHAQPLLRERPSLEPAIRFLRETCAKITGA